MDEVAAMREKNERNARVQARYDALMAVGKHGHYETMFKVVREEVEAERKRCADIARGYPEAFGTEYVAHGLIGKGQDGAARDIAAALGGEDT